MPLMKRRVDTPQSVTGRALCILGAFGPPHPTLTLSEISDRSGLPLTTTFRLLGELVEWAPWSATRIAGTGSDRGWLRSRPSPTHRQRQPIGIGR